MANYGGGRGRGDYGGGRGRGRGDVGGRGDFGGRGGGRGDYGGGRGRGDYGGRGGGRGDYGGRGDFGGRGGGRGDFRGRGGRGDFAGRGGGGRGGGGGGRFDSSGPMAPMRDAEEGSAARPGRRVTMASAQEINDRLAAQMANLDLTLKDGSTPPLSLVRPLKPRPGTLGRAVQVFANHFPVKCTLGEASHYDVDIVGKRKALQKGEEERKPIRGGKAGREKAMPSDLLREVMNEVAKQQNWPLGSWAFDGRKNIYSPSKFLPQRSQYEVDIAEEGRKKPRAFVVTITYAASVSIQRLLDFIKGRPGADVPQDAIQALDSALNASAANSVLCTSVSRACFFQGSGTFGISGGAEVWLGYRQSLRPCENGLTLNIDVAATAFLAPQPVLRFLSNIVRKREELLTLQDRAELRKAQKAIFGLKVNPTHSNTKRTYKVRGIKAEGGAAAAMFDNVEKGCTQSVAEYFEEHYGVKLKFPHHPMLNVGTPQREVLLPIEVCTLAPGQRQLKLDPKQTGDMIKITATGPADRMGRINRALQKDSRLAHDPVAKGFKMDVSEQMALVNGRYLPSPHLAYATEFGQPKNGSWNLMNVRLKDGATLTSFGICSFAPENSVGRPGPEGFPGMMQHMMAKLREVGLKVPQGQRGEVLIPPIVYHQGQQRFPGETVEEAARQGAAFFKAGPQIIFVLLPDNSLSNAYNDVKRASDSYLGIPTQCFAANRAKLGYPPDNAREQYLANVAMKVNAKLKGTNVVISRNPYPWMAEPYMVLGADVTHSRGFDKSEPSVAAVVASISFPHPTQYSCRVRIQGHRVEMVQDLKGMLKELLISYYKNTGSKKPKRLLFYRDGVSEGQFAEAMRTEVPQIIAACREIGRASNEDYSPPLTFLVAQKRHNTRLFPKDPREGDRKGNVQPGLVVDTKVVHPADFSFFLNSHAGIQGTNRPCHYHVLFDQCKFSADELQNFTNSLCYLYCRCSRSVSIASPAYYAHLAAARGKIMIAPGNASDTESSISGSHSSGPNSAEFANIHQNLKDVMFYV